MVFLSQQEIFHTSVQAVRKSDFECYVLAKGMCPIHLRPLWCMELQASYFSVCEADDIRQPCHAPFLPSFRPGCTQLSEGSACRVSLNRNCVKNFLLVRRSVCVCVQGALFHAILIQLPCNDNISKDRCCSSFGLQVVTYLSESTCVSVLVWPMPDWSRTVLKAGLFKTV